jgi:hypothetical protein
MSTVDFITELFYRIDNKMEGERANVVRQREVG